MEKIHFHYQQAVGFLRSRKALKNFLTELAKREKKKIERIDYIFCSDEELLGINLEFLGHDDYTDIISFDWTEAGQAIKGEIYISIDRIYENAEINKVSAVEELHRVIFHGMLHLCGYKDKLNHEKIQMRAKEDFYLGRYFQKT
jgi:rRNA maturation RNase YbeY